MLKIIIDASLLSCVFNEPCIMEPKVKTLLNNNSTYKVTGSLWIECDGERFFGPGRAELLLGIEETGSISKAARLMGMSYKKAWEMINTLNTQTPKPFVITQTGGEKGGGSVITTEAKKFISYHRQLRQRFLDFIGKETEHLTSL